MAPVRVSCVYCGGDHADAAGVRACFEQRKAAAGRASGTPRPAALKVTDAEEMRANPTVTEELLTVALRRRVALSIETQANILGWIVDIYVPAARLVVEIDGKSHTGREAEDARRDEHMRAERYTVVRVPASDAQRDVGSVVRRIEALFPPAAREEQQRLDDEAAMLRRDDIGSQTSDPARTRTPARQAVRAMAYPYVCTACARGFRSAEQPMPDCRHCRSSQHVKLACRCGAVALRGRYRCADCDVAQDAAGPRARAYTGQPPRHARRGKKI